MVNGNFRIAPSNIFYVKNVRNQINGIGISIFIFLFIVILNYPTDPSPESGAQWIYDEFTRTIGTNVNLLYMINS